MGNFGRLDSDVIASSDALQNRPADNKRFHTGYKSKVRIFPIFIFIIIIEKELNSFITVTYLFLELIFVFFDEPEMLTLLSVVAVI